MNTQFLTTLVLFLLPVGVGLSTGVSIFTFYYADGGSYFKDNPKACMNCHIMRPHFDSWNQSSHRAVAKCNDCHAPKEIIGKLSTKAINGFNHSLAFTLNTYSEPIKIKSYNLNIAQKACLNCHGNILNPTQLKFKNDSLSCVKCHKGVGHSF